MTFASHILAPTDFSRASEIGVRAAIELSKQLSARVSLVHAYDPDAVRSPSSWGINDEQRAALDQKIHRAVERRFKEFLAGRFPELADAERAVVHGRSPALAICAHAEKIGAELIVMATHGRTGLSQAIIGSVAERVVRQASCPVLTLRAKLDG